MPCFLEKGLGRRLPIGGLAAALCGCSASRALPVATNGFSAWTESFRTSIHFVINIPKGHRRSHYISTATQSISIKTYDATHTSLLSTTISNLTPSSPGCVGASASTSCSIAIDVPAGRYTFDVTTYDKTGAAGHALSALADYPFTVIAGKANAIPLTLGGLAASFNIVLSNAPQATYTSSTGISITGSKPQQIRIFALDASGHTIVGGGAPAPVIDATPASTTLAASGPNTWTMTSTYASATNPTIPANVTLSVTATPVPGSGGTTLHAAIPVQLYDPWIYVVDVTARTLFAYDESGTKKTLSGGFLGINAAYGATYVPGTNWVYVSDEAVSRMKVYDVAGTAVTPSASTPFPNLSAPYQSAFDSHDGLIYVPNYTGNSITGYDAQGNQQTVPSFNLGGSFLNAPIAMLYDPHNTFLYIANYGNSTVAAYNEQGIQETDQASTFKNLSGPAGLAFDPRDNFIYVANESAGVTAYDESGAQQTLGGSFNGTSNPAGVAYDPYDGLLYVANYGGANVTAYDEQGNQQTLTGTFSGLTHPWGIFVVP